jgi:hypothetical protein
MKIFSCVCSIQHDNADYSNKPETVTGLHFVLTPLVGPGLQEGTSQALKMESQRSLDRNVAIC